MGKSSPEHRAEYRRKNREKLAAKQRQYRLDNLDRIKAYRQENADVIAEYQRDYAAGWRARNAEKVKADRRDDYLLNRGAYIAAAVRWQRENPERHRENSRRHARLRYVAKDTEDFAYVVAIQGDPCSYCGGAMQAVDHIHPLAKGGLNQWDNLTAACKSCNSSKRDRSLLTFLIERTR